MKGVAPHSRIMSTNSLINNSGVSNDSWYACRVCVCSMGPPKHAGRSRASGPHPSSVILLVPLNNSTPRITDRLRPSGLQKGQNGHHHNRQRPGPDALHPWLRQWVAEPAPHCGRKARLSPRPACTRVVLRRAEWPQGP
jgi:hypothetical protein